MAVEPRWLGAYREILRRLQAGELPPGSRLPSEPEFARALGVSRATLREALLVLQEDGYIVRVHGSGTYVKARAPRATVGLERELEPLRLIDPTDRSITRTVLMDEIQPADETTGPRLGVPAGEPLRVISCRLDMTGEVLGHCAVFLVAGRQVRELPPDRLTRVEGIEEALGVTVRRATAELVPTVLGGFFGGLLGLPPTHPALLLAQRLETASGEPVGHRRFHMVASGRALVVIQTVPPPSSKGRTKGGGPATPPA